MVIASGSWIQNASDPNQEKMSATGILICHDNSYPFQERTLSLEQPIKIGRSVARARAATDNAIFDCKVLSRNHALLWYDTGKFYLKDTKSSNGTFINNKRLSPSGEESVACEVCSGDVVQFGVDVVESTKKVTHGCIVATLKLYLPDGKEAKASLSNSVAYVNVTLEDLYKLNQYIQEAGRRENALRSKLEYMQQLLQHAKIAANQSWKALVLEDCLLSRLEMLESQVIAYSKNCGEDKLRIELLNLIEDKAQYQNATKELLQKKVQEKREIIGKVQILKSQLSETEEETHSLHNVIKDNQNELQELAIKYIKIQQTLQDTTEKLNKTKIKLKDVIQQSEKEKQEFIRKLEDQRSIEKNLQITLRDSKLDSVHIHKQISALRNYMQALQDKKCITDESTDCKEYLNSIDAINFILSKCNSMYVEILDNEMQSAEAQQENLTNSINNSSKFCKPINIPDSFGKIHYGKSLIQENNHYKYILPPVSTKALLMTNNVIDSNNFKDMFKTEFLTSNSENSIRFTKDTHIDVQKINASISLSEDINNGEKENVASVKLIMRFSTDKNDNNFDKKMFNSNLQSELDLDSKNFLKNSQSTEILNVVHQVKNVIETNPSLLSNSSESKYEKMYLQCDSLINTLKPSIKNQFTLNKYSQEFLLQNIIKSSNFLQRNDDNDNYNIIIQEIQDLKNWLLHEPNEIIINNLKKYYYQIKKETQEIQELSEQLVILKEKYNSTIEEKTKITQKYIKLESQCKNFINTTYMVPVYYVAPILLALIWMLLEKIM